MPNAGSHLFQELTRQEITELLQAHTECELRQYTLQSGGLFNTTYKIEATDGRRMILRVGPIHPELLLYYEKDMMAAEAFVFHAMETAGIPCSHIVATGKINHRDYMLVDFIESVPLSCIRLSESERSLVMNEAVEALSRLHIMIGPAYGRVAEVLQGRGHPDWYSHVIYEMETLMKQARSCGSFSAAEAEHLIACIHHCKDALSEVTRPTLCHGDLWDGNVLVKQTDDEWHLAAIIDVDRSLYGDIDFDLACPWFRHEDHINKPNNSHNRRIRRAVYDLLFFLYEAHVWFLQYDNKRHADHSRRLVLQKATALLQNKIQ